MVHKQQKRSLLIAINCIAGLSIFFFGYDQGMMGGVNNAPDYYYKTMKFGHRNQDTGAPVIDNTLLQGGIVCITSVETPNTALIDQGVDLLCWYSSRVSCGRLVRRSIWPYQDHRSWCAMGNHRCFAPNFCAESCLDDLRYVDRPG